jgi:hypothetical protein
MFVPEVRNRWFLLLGHGEESTSGAGDSDDRVFSTKQAEHVAHPAMSIRVTDQKPIVVRAVHR